MTDTLLSDKDIRSSLLNSLSDGIFIVDEKHVIEYANSTARHTIGLNNNQLVGHLFESVVELQANGAEANLELSPITQAQSKKGMYSSNSRPDIRLTMARADRSILAVSITVIPFEDSGSHYLVIFHDSSADEKIDRAKSEFIALVSHQLRTPINIISWYVEKLFNENHGDLNPAQKDYLEEVQKSNKRVTDLVQAIVNVSRTDLNKIKHKHETVKMAEVMSRIITDLTELAKTKNISLRVNSPKKDIVLEDSDSELLGVAVRNIVKNAVQYTPDGGLVEIDVQTYETASNTVPIEIDEKITKPGYVISIKDTGIGIPDEEKDHIFIKLFRASNVQALDVTGVGLGLYIAQNFIQELGGTIWFESELRKGTTVSVFVPS